MASNTERAPRADARRTGGNRYHAKSRPTELVRSPWGDLLVVETGVDPVTSRFSGARSTD
jgi:hypothetical protein